MANNRSRVRRRAVLRRIGAALNAPISITLVSGLLIAAVANHWREAAAQRTRMEQAYVESADGFARILNILPTLKNYEVQIYAKRISANSRKSLRNDSELEKKYEEAVIRLEKIPDSRALCGRVFGAFEAAASGTLCDQLQEKVDAIAEEQDLQTSLQIHAEAWDAYKRLLRSMANQLQR